MLEARIRKNHQITLPKELMKEYHISEGDRIEFIKKGDVFVIEPRKTIDPRQGWYWTKKWQTEMEKAEDDLTEGRVSSFDTAEDMIKGLKK